MVEFIENELKQYELNLSNPQVKVIYENMILASNVLSKEELTVMLEDYIDLYGSSLY